MDRKFVILFLIISVLLAVFISPFASKSPDGLEKVAATHHFIDKANSTIKSPIAEYLLPVIKNEKLATALAGLVGTIISFGIAYLIGYLLKSKRKAI